ncbi:MAG: hypothetical protein Q7S33_02590 [Nanoarchaeota archaeon]|nr:hypothetical protein [Nanoarchaeota archaeon]
MAEPEKNSALGLESKVLETPILERIEHICRVYSTETISETPKDAELARMKQGFETSYKNYLASYDNGKKEVNRIIEKLKQDSEKMLKSYTTFWNVLRNTDSVDKNETTRIAGMLISDKEELSSLQKIIENSYNSHSNLIYTISKGISGLQDKIKDYQDEKQTVERDLRFLHELHTTPKKLKVHIDSVVEEKRKKENISEDQKRDLVKTLMSKGEERLGLLSKRYLEIKNDIPLAQSMLSYSSLAESCNELMDSFEVIRERLIEETTKIQEIINTYEIVTTRQADFLKDMDLPKPFLDVIGRFVEGIEKVDQEFSEKVLANTFRTRAYITQPTLDEVTHSLVREIREKEKGKSENPAGE